MTGMRVTGGQKKVVVEKNIFECHDATPDCKVWGSKLRGHTCEVEFAKRICQLTVEKFYLLISSQITTSGDWFSTASRKTSACSPRLPTGIQRAEVCRLSELMYGIRCE